MCAFASGRSCQCAAASPSALRVAGGFASFFPSSLASCSYESRSSFSSLTSSSSAPFTSYSPPSAVSCVLSPSSSPSCLETLLLFCGAIIEYMGVPDIYRALPLTCRALRYEIYFSECSSFHWRAVQSRQGMMKCLLFRLDPTYILSERRSKGVIRIARVPCALLPDKNSQVQIVASSLPSSPSKRPTATCDSSAFSNVRRRKRKKWSHYRSPVGGTSAYGTVKTYQRASAYKHPATSSYSSFGVDPVSCLAGHLESSSGVPALSRSFSTNCSTEYDELSIASWACAHGLPRDADTLAVPQSPRPAHNATRSHEKFALLYKAASFPLERRRSRSSPPIRMSPAGVPRPQFCARYSSCAQRLLSASTSHISSVSHDSSALTYSACITSPSPKRSLRQCPPSSSHASALCFQAENLGSVSAFAFVTVRSVDCASANAEVDDGIPASFLREIALLQRIQQVEDSLLCPRKRRQAGELSQPEYMTCFTNVGETRTRRKEPSSGEAEEAGVALSRSRAIETSGTCKKHHQKRRRFRHRGPSDDAAYCRESHFLQQISGSRAPVESQPLCAKCKVHNSYFSRTPRRKCATFTMSNCCSANSAKTGCGSHITRLLGFELSDGQLHVVTEYAEKDLRTFWNELRCAGYLLSREALDSYASESFRWGHGEKSDGTSFPAGVRAASSTASRVKDFYYDTAPVTSGLSSEDVLASANARAFPSAEPSSATADVNLRSARAGQTLHSRKLPTSAGLSNDTWYRWLTREMHRELVWRVLQQVLHGLLFLHTQGIAHRNLKPENILIYWRRNVPSLSSSFQHQLAQRTSFGMSCAQQSSTSISRRVDKPCALAKRVRSFTAGVDLPHVQAAAAVSTREKDASYLQFRREEVLGDAVSTVKQTAVPQGQPIKVEADFSLASGNRMPEWSPSGCLREAVNEFIEDVASHFIAKITDLGTGRLLEESQGPYTPENPKDRERSYRESRRLYYRAPELLLLRNDNGAADVPRFSSFSTSSPPSTPPPLRSNYSVWVDIWSVGVLFMELALLAPPFRADSELLYLLQVFELLGTPTTAAEWTAVCGLPYRVKRAHTQKRRGRRRQLSSQRYGWSRIHQVLAPQLPLQQGDEQATSPFERDIQRRLPACGSPFACAASSGVVPVAAYSCTSPNTLSAIRETHLTSLAPSIRTDVFAYTADNQWEESWSLQEGIFAKKRVRTTSNTLPPSIRRRICTKGTDPSPSKILSEENGNGHEQPDFYLAHGEGAMESALTALCSEPSTWQQGSDARKCYNGLMGFHRGVEGQDTAGRLSVFDSDTYVCSYAGNSATSANSPSWHDRCGMYNHPPYRSSIAGCQTTARGKLRTATDTSTSGRTPRIRFYRAGGTMNSPDSIESSANHCSSISSLSVTSEDNSNNSTPSLGLSSSDAETTGPPDEISRLLQQMPLWSPPQWRAIRARLRLEEAVEAFEIEQQITATVVTAPKEDEGKRKCTAGPGYTWNRESFDKRGQQSVHSWTEHKQINPVAKEENQARTFLREIGTDGGGKEHQRSERGKVTRKERGREDGDAEGAHARGECQLASHEGSGQKYKAVSAFSTQEKKTEEAPKASSSLETPYEPEEHFRGHGQVSCPFREQVTDTLAARRRGSSDGQQVLRVCIKTKSGALRSFIWECVSMPTVQDGVQDINQTVPAKAATCVARTATVEAATEEPVLAAAIREKLVILNGMTAHTQNDLCTNDAKGVQLSHQRASGGHAVGLNPRLESSPPGSIDSLSEVPTVCPQVRSAGTTEGLPELGKHFSESAPHRHLSGKIRQGRSDKRRQSAPGEDRTQPGRGRLLLQFGRVMGVEALELLQLMLVLNGEKRITADLPGLLRASAAADIKTKLFSSRQGSQGCIRNERRLPLSAGQGSTLLPEATGNEAAVTHSCSTATAIEVAPPLAHVENTALSCWTSAPAAYCQMQKPIALPKPPIQTHALASSLSLKDAAGILESTAQRNTSAATCTISTRPSPAMCQAPAAIEDYAGEQAFTLRYSETRKYPTPAPIAFLPLLLRLHSLSEPEKGLPVQLCMQQTAAALAAAIKKCQTCASESCESCGVFMKDLKSRVACAGTAEEGLCAPRRDMHTSSLSQRQSQRMEDQTGSEVSRSDTARVCCVRCRWCCCICCRTASIHHQLVHQEHLRSMVSGALEEARQTAIDLLFWLQQEFHLKPSTLHLAAHMFHQCFNQMLLPSLIAAQYDTPVVLRCPSRLHNFKRRCTTDCRSSASCSFFSCPASPFGPLTSSSLCNHCPSSSLCDFRDPSFTGFCCCRSPGCSAGYGPGAAAAAVEHEAPADAFSSVSSSASSGYMQGGTLEGHLCLLPERSQEEPTQATEGNCNAYAASEQPAETQGFTGGGESPPPCLVLSACTSSVAKHLKRCICRGHIQRQLGEKNHPSVAPGSPGFVSTGPPQAVKKERAHPAELSSIDHSSGCLAMKTAFAREEHWVHSHETAGASAETPAVPVMHDDDTQIRRFAPSSTIESDNCATGNEAATPRDEACNALDHSGEWQTLPLEMHVLLPCRWLRQMLRVTVACMKLADVYNERSLEYYKTTNARDYAANVMEYASAKKVMQSAHCPWCIRCTGDAKCIPFTQLHRNTRCSERHGAGAEHAASAAVRPYNSCSFENGRMPLTILPTTSTGKETRQELSVGRSSPRSSCPPINVGCSSLDRPGCNADSFLPSKKLTQRSPGQQPVGSPGQLSAANDVVQTHMTRCVENESCAWSETWSAEEIVKEEKKVFELLEGKLAVATTAWCLSLLWEVTEKHTLLLRQQKAKSQRGDCPKEHRLAMQDTPAVASEVAHSYTLQQHSSTPCCRRQSLQEAAELRQVLSSHNEDMLQEAARPLLDGHTSHQQHKQQPSKDGCCPKHQRHEARFIRRSKSIARPTRHLEEKGRDAPDGGHTVAVTSISRMHRQYLAPVTVPAAVSRGIPLPSDQATSLSSCPVSPRLSITSTGKNTVNLSPFSFLWPSASLPHYAPSFNGYMMPTTFTFELSPSVCSRSRPSILTQLARSCPLSTAVQHTPGFQPGSIFPLPATSVGLSESAFNHCASGKRPLSHVASPVAMYSASPRVSTFRTVGDLSCPAGLVRAQQCEPEGSKGQHQRCNSKDEAFAVPEIPTTSTLAICRRYSQLLLDLSLYQVSLFHFPPLLVARVLLLQSLYTLLPHLFQSKSQTRETAACLPSPFKGKVVNKQRTDAPNAGTLAPAATAANQTFNAVASTPSTVLHTTSPRTLACNAISSCTALPSVSPGVLAADKPRSASPSLFDLHRADRVSASAASSADRAQESRCMSSTLCTSSVGSSPAASLPSSPHSASHNVHTVRVTAPHAAAPNKLKGNHSPNEKRNCAYTPKTNCPLLSKWNSASSCSVDSFQTIEFLRRQHMSEGHFERRLGSEDQLEQSRETQDGAFYSVHCRCANIPLIRKVLGPVLLLSRFPEQLILHMQRRWEKAVCQAGFYREVSWQSPTSAGSDVGCERKDAARLNHAQMLKRCMLRARNAPQQRCTRPVTETQGQTAIRETSSNTDSEDGRRRVHELLQCAAATAALPSTVRAQQQLRCSPLLVACIPDPAVNGQRREGHVEDNQPHAGARAEAENNEEEAIPWRSPPPALQFLQFVEQKRAQRLTELQKTEQPRQHGKTEVSLQSYQRQRSATGYAQQRLQHNQEREQLYRQEKDPDQGHNGGETWEDGRREHENRNSDGEGNSQCGTAPQWSRASAVTTEVAARNLCAHPSNSTVSGATVCRQQRQSSSALRQVPPHQSRLQKERCRVYLDTAEATVHSVGGKSNCCDNNAPCLSKSLSEHISRSPSYSFTRAEQSEAGPDRCYYDPGAGNILLPTDKKAAACHGRAATLAVVSASSAYRAQVGIKPFHASSAVHDRLRSCAAAAGKSLPCTPGRCFNVAKCEHAKPTYIVSSTSSPAESCVSQLPHSSSPAGKSCTAAADCARPSAKITTLHDEGLNHPSRWRPHPSAYCEDTIKPAQSKDECRGPLETMRENKSCFRLHCCGSSTCRLQSTYHAHGFFLPPEALELLLAGSQADTLFLYSLLQSGLGDVTTEGANAYS